MKSLVELKIADKEYEIFSMPATRVIGKAYICPFNPDETPWQKILEGYRAIKPRLDTLPNLLKNGMICWLGNVSDSEKHYIYMSLILLSKIAKKTIAITK